MDQKTHRILAGLLLLTIILISMTGCSDSSDNYTDEQINSTFTFAVISDSHIKSSLEYTTDHDWERAAKRLKTVADQLTTGDPVDFVVHTGDHVNDLYCPKESWPTLCTPFCNHIKPDYLTYKCCECNVNCYGEQHYDGPIGLIGSHSNCPPGIMRHTYADIVHNSFAAIPEYFMVLGNHDDRWYDILTKKFHVIRDPAKEAWGRVFGKEKSTVFPVAPAKFERIQFKDSSGKNYSAACYEVLYHGFQLIMLDSTADPHASNDGISFGEEQLRWLDDTLKNNTNPAILFWHRNPGTAIEDVPAPDDPGFDDTKYHYLKILYSHRNKIKYIFVGHSHSYNRYTWKAGGVKFYETTSTMCLEQINPVYYLVECNPADGSVKIINEDQIFSNPMAKVACKAY